MFWSLWCVRFVVLRGWGNGRVRAWCSASVHGLLQCAHARQVLRYPVQSWQVMRYFTHGRIAMQLPSANSATMLLQLRVIHDVGDKADCKIRTNFLKLDTLLAIPNYRLSLENLRQLRAILGPSLGRPLGTTVEPSSVYLESISSRCTPPSDDRAARKVGAQQRVANLRVFPLYFPWLRWFSKVIWGPAWGYLGVPLDLSWEHIRPSWTILSRFGTITQPEKLTGEGEAKTYAETS